MISRLSSIPKEKIKRLGIQKLKYLIHSKYSTELTFQKQWLNEFLLSKDKVLEYWKKYRYLEKIIEVCKITKDKKILDVGCGLSSVLHFIKGKRFGIDPLADEYLKLYQYPKGIIIKKAFSEYLPFTDTYFDVVFCSNVLDHVTNPKKTVREMSRVLKEGGFFVLTVEVFDAQTIRDPAHPQSFLVEDVLKLLRSDFKIISKNTSDWIGLRRYIEGSTKSMRSELVIIAESRKEEERTFFSSIEHDENYLLASH